MMRSVFLKTLYEKRAFIIGWTLGLMALAMLMTSFFPAMRTTGGLDSIARNLPAAFQGLIGDLADLQTFERYIASQLFDIRVPLIVGIMAIILGLGLSTREEEDGELRTLLGLPLRRSKLLFEKWLAMVVIMMITVCGLVAGVYVMMPFIDDAELSGAHMFKLALLTWLVMTTYGTITFAAGMASGKRGFASFVGIMVIIGSFLLSTFGSAVDWLEPYEKISLLHYFPAVDIVKTGIEWQNVAVLVAITIGALLLAWLVFRRRDVA